MDLNTVSHLARPSNWDKIPNWCDGDAWLAGGTWLFSEPARRTPAHRSGRAAAGNHYKSTSGDQIAATCTICRLDAFSAHEEWRAAAPDSPMLSVVAGVFQDLEHRHGGRQYLHVPAGRGDYITNGRPGRRLHHLAARRRRAPRTGDRFYHGRS